MQESADHNYARLASAMEENEQIDAILLDFSKAFDTVSHQRLAIKLHHY